jgi:hypothetical protein
MKDFVSGLAISFIVLEITRIVGREIIKEVKPTCATKKCVK